MIGYRILAIIVFLMLVLPMTAAGVETTNVTIEEDSYVALNNDIYIEVLDVSGNMGWSARVHFYSYLDSVGKKTTLYTGDVATEYVSGTGMKIKVKLDSVFSNAAFFVIESSNKLYVTERHDADVGTANVTIGLNECIVLNNDIYIELLDVGSDMIPDTKVWFYSYQDPVGKKTTLYRGDIPTQYTSGSGLTIDVTLDSVSSNAASFEIESSKELYVTERHAAEGEVPDIDNDGVPDMWDLDNSTPADYWTDSDGRGRMWGDMNGDGKLTSADALLLLQAVVGKIDIE